MNYIQYFEELLGASRCSYGVNRAFRCPMCDGMGSDRHLYVNVTTGVYNCFRCGNKGNAITLAKFMGNKPPSYLETPEVEPILFDNEIATQVYTHILMNSTLSETDRTELVEKRGIVNPERFGLRTLNGTVTELVRNFCEEELILSGLFYDDAGFLVPRSAISDGRLFIPYIHKSLVVYMRTRGSGIKYLSPKYAQTKNHVWGKLQSKKQSVIVTEGELKAISAASHGANILALPGMNSSYETLVSILHEAAIKNVVICFDTQIAHMDDVDKAAKRLSQMLVEELDISVSRVILPLLGNDKMDIDTFIVEAGWAAFKKLIRSGGTPYVNTASMPGGRF